MRIERLDVVLRARSAWEAMELGSALVRRHAGAIWKPWLLISVPLFALLNLGAWAIDQLWLAGLLLWWLKPVLDRIPLFVISRGVFGDVPRVRDTLRAQLRWGWRPMFGYLTWRRLSPARTVFMPLELLEGASAEQQRQRRRTLGGAVYGHALLLASVCWHFEAMLLLACIAAIAMFVPVDLLPETARAAWALIGDENPVWADVGLNAFGWLATTLIEPFFVGAGFGLYLNRRTEIEAWDVEMALRRLRERLGGAAPLLLALVLLGAPGAALRAQTAAPGAGGPAVAAEPQARPAPAPQPVQEAAGGDGDIKDPAKAQEKSADDAPEPVALDDVFDTVPAADARFDRAADRTYEDPLLSGKRSIGYWKKRDRNDDDDEKKPDPAKPDPRFGEGLLTSVAAVFAFVGEWGMWLLAGMLVLVLLLTAKHWLPWMRGSGRKRAPVETPVAHAPVLSAEPLPDDVATSARRLWRQGRQRDALALLYRASVATVCERANLALPPGATEAQCLRASRRLPDDADRDLFARMVRTWQYAAYAGRMPDDDAFDALLDALQQQYRWRA
ncbi:DUF4129 domain-containing protein [Xanthomonas translucens]|uniref:DUF4129 domain-containing protein n=3 Tax=Xanthomonas campestris pv. translucens TaxID=343 RepID=UPI00071BAC92|nr:DUF4129 domain-containing protein [Xanthomonas translucens]MCT8283041.1 DUF4129 domain-containing protein [Xanthomonas translucens pv. undulosa]MCT8317801.1 DUF4129 domain-containing protein [Xanthomonas translucens pv. undulosa]QSQ56485.1 DUF4129 domain-containing protein [Xanthomonas translucens pv. undulosa]UKE40071.1 DUF4129 domain-containing protein [Xanthomonas translucens pv. undulosa]UKE43765.1 DUF4129 domain-containing protein [Xanthomonas translucens pv. secalis]